MTEDKRKAHLLKLFSSMSGKTKIVEPMKNIHGTLRDSDAIEREVALVMREITEQGIVMGETLGRYEGLLTGSPGLIPGAPSETVDLKPRRRRS